jgi:hypothetical protein
MSMRSSGRTDGMLEAGERTRTALNTAHEVNHVSFHGSLKPTLMSDRPVRSRSNRRNCSHAGMGAFAIQCSDFV